jgi:hypothetical protein
MTSVNALNDNYQLEMKALVKSVFSAETFVCFLDKII